MHTICRSTCASQSRCWNRSLHTHGQFQSCADLNTRDLISYCIYRNAEHLHTIDEVNTYCSLTEKWEEACRHSWAARRMHNALPSDFDALIVGCAGFSDCAMEFYRWAPNTRQYTSTQSMQKVCTSRQTGLLATCHADVGQHAPNTKKKR